MDSPLTGAWEIIEGPRKGMIVFTDSYYSLMEVDGNRARFQGNQPTNVEIVEAYNTMIMSAGTYTISGSVITFQRKYTRNPNVAGTDEDIEFRVDGDKLRAQAIRPDGTRGGERIFQKVG